jgi:YHS domain-containing protein
MKTFPLLTVTLLLAAPAMAQSPLERIREDLEAEKAAEAEITVPTELLPQTTCPLTGNEIRNRGFFVDYEGQRFYVCCPACLPEARSNPERIAMDLFAAGVQLENVQAVDPVTGEKLEGKKFFHQLYNKRIYVNDEKDVAKVAADPAKYLDVLEGRKLQERCAVMGGKINPEVNFEIEGFTIGQCCPGCAKEWKADPAAHFAVLEKRKEVVEAAAMTCPVMPKMDGSKSYPVTLGAKRYYFCSEKTALMFVKNPDKYLPQWLAAH